jgi:hypothetical protein
MANRKSKDHPGRILRQARVSIKKGRRIVPIPPGKKGPVLSGWPLLQITETDLSKYFGQHDNIGWITGSVSGDLVDVDLDCAEAVDLGKTFLPPTERIHGRDGREMSHYWYTVTPPPPPTKFNDVDGACLVELRSDGQQTLVPPSLHPNGERLFWHATGDPLRVEGDVLFKAVRKIAGAALLIRHWPAPGQRHDAAKALAGMLLRAGWDEAETTELISAVANTAGDEELQDRVNGVVSTAKKIASGGKATGAPALAQIIGDDVVDRLRQFLELGPNGVPPSFAVLSEWPNPASLGETLPPVQALKLDLLPDSLRPLIEDVSERMQTPPDSPAAAAVVALAGCVNRRARMQPKAYDDSWSVVLNLWGAIVAPPGFMKTPILSAVTAPLNKIEGAWQAEYEHELKEHEKLKAKADIELSVWRNRAKKALEQNQPEVAPPELLLEKPVERRLLTTDATFEKLHAVLHDNPAGLLVVRDELTGWLAALEREGREGERTFYLQAWSGDQPYRLERIGRGSILVPEVCVSLIGNIQPARLRWYLADTVRGGAGDDGLFQRFQLMVWPDSPQGEWQNIDRPPNATAISTAKRVFERLAGVSADDPIRVRFSAEAQPMFNDWLGALEKRLRDEAALAPAMMSHLSKYRSLMPTLAALFELADRVDSHGSWDEPAVDDKHTEQAIGYCKYLESHANRAYSCVVSPECRAARDLGQRIEAGKLPDKFATREVYLKGWSGLDKPETARAALTILEDAGWLRKVKYESPSTGGRPSEMWQLNPKIKKK